MIHKLLNILLILLLVPPMILSAKASDDQIQGKEQELEQLRRELAQKRAAKEKLAGQEKNVLSEVQNLEERVDLAEKLLSKLKRKKETCQGEVKNLQVKLQAAEIRAASRQAILAERTRQMYMHGRLDELEAFLSAESLPDLARRAHQYRRIAEQDQQLIRRAKSDQLAIAENKTDLEKQLQETVALETEKTREENTLKREKSSRNKLLQEIRNEKAAHEQAIREIEESARQLQDIIDRLERERTRPAPPVPEPAEFKLKAGLFEKSKGSLPWPVQGKVIGEFGKRKHPKYKTVTFNKGIDIQAPLDAEIRAVFTGKVLYTSWLRGYGKFLILSHQNGYYTLYAHASELLVEEGDIVDAGAVIARVGETGSLEGPKLHFEVRHSKEQLDPREWLR
jgi:septal ring factor EnvC (AmiA/AmiB activator)